MIANYFTKYFVTIAIVLFTAVLLSVVIAPTASFAQTKPSTTNTTTTTTTTKNAAEENIDETGRSGFVICGNTVDTPCNVAHLFRAFIIIINYLITMAGFVAVLFIVIAGVQMVISQGQDQLKQAKQRIAGAIIGLVLVALAFVLVNSLLAGSLNLGIKQGALILSSPKEYINESLNNSVTPTTNSNTTAPTTNKPNETTPKK